MIVGCFGTNEKCEKDFSFVKEEIKNLKDIPREFDVDLYRKLDVSETVIEYWRDIDYKLSFYFLFWLLQMCRRNFSFMEYRELCDKFAEKIFEENERIGDAIKDYCRQEQLGYEWMIKSDKSYVYAMDYKYSDGSGENVCIIWNYNEMIQAMHKEIEKGDRDITFDATRHPVIYSENGEFQGININECCGRLSFDCDGELMDCDDVKGFGYDYTCALDLINPYIFIPHPFKKGDIVSFLYGDERIYGVLSHPHDENESKDYEARGIAHDGSDFTALVETVYEQDKRFTFGHDHICPVYFEKYTEKINYSEGEMLSVLGVASDILKGESGSLSSLMYYMKQ